jgi:hypothetical protein
MLNNAQELADAFVRAIEQEKDIEIPQDGKNMLLSIAKRIVSGEIDYKNPNLYQYKSFRVGSVFTKEFYRIIRDTVKMEIDKMLPPSKPIF